MIEALHESSRRIPTCFTPCSARLIPISSRMRARRIATAEGACRRSRRCRPCRLHRRVPRAWRADRLSPAADIYVTPYPTRRRLLGHAFLCGRRSARRSSDPYVHATEILGDGHGVLVDFGDSAAFAREINALLGSDRNRIKLSERAYARAGPMGDLAAARRTGDAPRSPRWSAPSRAA